MNYRKFFPSDFPGHGDLLDTMKKCLQATKGEDKPSKFFKNAIKILQSEKITCLKIKDYGTSGLRDGKGRRN